MSAARFVAARDRVGPEAGLIWAVWDRDARRYVDFCKSKKEATMYARFYEQNPERAEAY